MRIIMAVTNDLVTDQRVHRSCTALTEAGYDVTLIGRLLPVSLPVSRDYHTERMRLIFRRKAFFYAEYNIRLFLRLVFAKVDAIYSNDTDTLAACYLAARLRGKPLFFDAHEMFPEVPELVGRTRVKRFWERIEAFVLPRMSRRKDMAAVTVCQSIANIYKERYGITMAVVRNVPMREDCVKDVDIRELLQMIPKGRRILLYQGAVNVGRGIEAVMDAMPHLNDCQLIVAGVGDKYEELRRRAEGMECDNITFLGRVEPSMLHGLTRHADLGISLLENRGLNYYYSLPNRIADFVQAGVPVLATDFPEIHRVVENYGIGTLVPPAKYNPTTRESEWPNSEEMCKIIKDSLSSWDSVSDEHKARLFSKASADLSWDNDKKILLNVIDTIISKKSS